MNKFIQYLKEKGYKIYGNKAVLLETEFAKDIKLQLWENKNLTG